MSLAADEANGSTIPPAITLNHLNRLIESIAQGHQRGRWIRNIQTQKCFPKRAECAAIAQTTQSDRRSFTDVGLAERFRGLELAENLGSPMAAARVRVRQFRDRAPPTVPEALRYDRVAPGLGQGWLGQSSCCALGAAAQGSQHVGEGPGAKGGMGAVAAWESHGSPGIWRSRGRKDMKTARVSA